MAYKLSIFLSELGAVADDNQLLVTSEVPFADLEEATAAYKRALGSASGTNPLDVLAGAAKALNQCRSMKFRSGDTTLVCARPRGHEAKGENHRAATGDEW